MQTVSRVINDEPNVRPAMKEKVQASIDRLGYVPSIAAQRMSGSRSYLVMALNDRERTIADWRARRGTDWVDQMMLGGMLKCAEHGYRLLVELLDTRNEHVERELSGAIAALRPDGVILTPPHSDNPLIVKLLHERAIPFARIGSRGVGAGISLTMGDEHAARMASEYLIEAGHQRIGFIAGPEEYSVSGWRITGWRAAMEAAGLDCEGLMARGAFTYASGEEAARALMQNPDRPTAIIASNDQMTFGTLAALREMGLEVPRDVSLISFDNTSGVRVTAPPLTAIDQPIAETTARAVELIIAAQKAQNDDERPDEPVEILGKLVERGSVARIVRNPG